MSDFGPVQLDALEDALEEYREILQWTRDAMPLAEVTPGLLDGVLDEARAVAPVAVPEVEARPATSWWKKLRGVFVIPALAVAGSAAAVLLLVRFGAEPESDATLAAQAEELQPVAANEPQSKTAAAETPPDGRPAGILEKGLADASVDDDLSRGRLRLSDDEARRAEAVQEPAAAEEDAAQERAPAAPAAEPPPPPSRERKKGRADDKVFYDEDDSDAPSKLPGSGGAPGGSASKPSPGRQSAVPPSDASKSKNKKDAEEANADAWGSISAADRLRRAGNCEAAKAEYRPLTGNGDRRVRARALAGLGLCEDAAGNEDAAETWFSKARKSDPDIAGFISHERALEQAPPNADVLEDSL